MDEKSCSSWSAAGAVGQIEEQLSGCERMPFKACTRLLHPPTS